MNFDKYKNLGDYHWRDYYSDTTTPYKKHVDKLVQWIGKDSNLLDIGAGDGLITSMFENCLGIEVNEYAVSIAKSKNVNIILGNAYKLPKNKMYDNVLLGDVLEHLEFPKLCFDEIKQVLNPKGYVYIAVPPPSVYDSYAYTQYSPKSLESLMRKNGFSLCQPIQILEENARMYGKFNLMIKTPPVSQRGLD